MKEMMDINDLDNSSERTSTKNREIYINNIIKPNKGIQKFLILIIIILFIFLAFISYIIYNEINKKNLKNRNEFFEDNEKYFKSLYENEKIEKERIIKEFNNYVNKTNIKYNEYLLNIKEKENENEILKENIKNLNLIIENEKN